MRVRGSGFRGLGCGVGGAGCRVLARTSAEFVSAGGRNSKEFSSCFSFIEALIPERIDFFVFSAPSHLPAPTQQARQPTQVLLDCTRFPRLKPMHALLSLRLRTGVRIRGMISTFPGGFWGLQRVLCKCHFSMGLVRFLWRFCTKVVNAYTGLLCSCCRTGDSKEGFAAFTGLGFLNPTLAHHNLPFCRFLL